MTDGYKISKIYVGSQEVWPPIVSQTFVVSAINTYTNLYKSWYTISKITAEWTVSFSGSKQFYLRIHTAQSESSWMYGYCFDYVNSTHRWELQYRSWNSYTNKHIWTNNELLNTWNTFKIEFTLDSASITLNDTTTPITYDTTESNRVATIFASWTPYFYTWQYWTLNSWTNTIKVEYAEA